MKDQPQKSRAIISVREDGVEVRSRNGKDISVTFPELAEIAQLAPLGTVVDGEVVALDRGSRPNFGLLQTRAKLTSRREIARAQKSTPVHCFVFDVLRTPDRGDVQDLHYDERRALLEGGPDRGGARADPGRVGPIGGDRT